MRTLPLCILALGVCCCSGGDKDWDHEIILSLFKLQGKDVTPLTLTISQEGGKTEPLEGLELAFTDCASNRVRIIPGSNEPLTISVKCRTPLLCSVPDTVVETPMSTDAVSIVLASTDVAPILKSSLEPQECAPDTSPTPGRKPLGEYCKVDSECEGGTCLKEVFDGATPLEFVNGYCTQTCDLETSDCEDQGGQCYEILGNLKPWCLKKCETNENCRVADNYTCKNSALCFPDQSQ